MTTLHRRHWIILFVAALIVGTWAASFGAGRLQAQAAGPADKTAVAVLNLQDVLSQLNENNAFQQATQAKNEQLQQELGNRQIAVKQMQNDLAYLAPDSEDYQAKEEQIFETLIELQTWQQVQEQRNILDQRTHLANLYRKVVQAGSSVAENQGIDLVLLDTQVPDLDRLNPEQLLNAIATRKVLYHNDSVDLTRQIIEQMNTEWNNR